jgi:CHASE2 domain-containing sensor protein
MQGSPPPRKNSILIDWLHAFVAALVAVLFVWSDFLETSTKTSKGGEDAIYHLLAPLQGPRLPNEPIVVVTISKDDLDAINAIKLKDVPDAMELSAADTWTWPLDGDKHTEILQKLEEFEPRAIFYDINFAQKRDGMAMFGAELSRLTGGAASGNDCRLAKGAKPTTGVFLSYEHGSPPLPELCNKGAEGAITGWTGQGNNYPLY